jgi:hypothetical protein
MTVASRTQPVWPRSTSAGVKAKTWSTWVRSGQAGRGRFPARSGSSSTPWSVRNRNSQSRLESRKLRGSSRHSLLMLSIGTSRPKGCSGKAPSRASSGTERRRDRFQNRRPDLPNGRQRRARYARDLWSKGRALRGSMNAVHGLAAWRYSGRPDGPQHAPDGPAECERFQWRAANWAR